MIALLPTQTSKPDSWFTVTILKNWQTSVPFLIALICGFIDKHPKYFNGLVIDIASYLMWAFGAIGALNTKYAGNGSNAPSHLADRVVENAKLVQNAETEGIESPPRNIS